MGGKVMNQYLADFVLRISSCEFQGFYLKMTLKSRIRILERVGVSRWDRYNRDINGQISNGEVSKLCR